MKPKLMVLVCGLWIGLGAGCASSRVAVVEDIAPMGMQATVPTHFVLNEDFWVYFYPRPIAAFALSGIPLSLRMTAASSGALGGWLGGRDRDFFGILPAGSQIRVAGMIRRKMGLCHVVEVTATSEKELLGTWIEIFSGRKNYSRHGADANMTRLSDVLFRPLEE